MGRDVPIVVAAPTVLPPGKSRFTPVPPLMCPARARQWSLGTRLDSSCISLQCTCKHTMTIYMYEGHTKF